MTVPVRVQTPRIAVTGATGEVGSRVAMLLAERGVAQRLPVRAARHAPRPAYADVVEVGGYSDRRGLRAALDGIETFLIIPGREPAAVDHYRAAVSVAAEAGVQRIVHLSRVGAAPDATFSDARDHWQIEEHVRASGLDWTIARMNLVIDRLPTLVRKTGEICGPAGTGRAAAIALEDVALSLAALVTGDGHEGQVYELTGPESLTFREVAGAMNRSGRHTIKYVPQTDEEATAMVSSLDISDEEKVRRLTAFAAAREGALEHVTGDVAYLTGHSPTNLADWLRTHPFALVHVGAII
ncbi:MAG: NAD(P)H-binding protein [Solirubrobacteraceae bacterium]|nr:NAD(P)H-binding protein [Solirubrobacteraceae bacterium]